MSFLVGKVLKIIGQSNNSPHFVKSSSSKNSGENKTHASNAKSKPAKNKTRGQMQREVEKGKAPRDVDRVDKPHDSKTGQEHVHLKNGGAVNKDGTIKEGKPK